MAKGRPKAAEPPRLPYDAGKEKLLEAIKEAGFGHLQYGLNNQAAVVWLPTHKHHPVASCPLISEAPGPGASVFLSPWQISTLVLPPPAEIELLCACMGKEVLAPGVIIGKDLDFGPRLSAWPGR
ncbi:MAG: hypothetical protein M1438_04115 [Deltaproteobacteria bacterium]|nr:hypothetical protein [Deltaproteobacteria bacterium]